MKLAGVLLPLAWLPALVAQGDQDDPRLDDLFARLQKAETATAAAPLEAQIWQIWIEHEDPAFAGLMLRGIELMNRNDLRAALQVYDQLIAQAPDFAEAWNKRATLYYLLQDYAASTADIDETLRREPFHFGALSGLGLVNLAQGRYLEAHRAFQTLLEIYPAMPGVRNTLAELDAMLGRSAI